LYHLLALLIVSVYTFGGSILLYKIVNAILPMRVRPDQEALGLDISQHNESVFAVEEDLHAKEKVKKMEYAE
jgi:Amt family ammonium transporter